MLMTGNAHLLAETSHKENENGPLKRFYHYLLYHNHNHNHDLTTSSNNYWTCKHNQLFKKGPNSHRDPFKYLPSSYTRTHYIPTLLTTALCCPQRYFKLMISFNWSRKKLKDLVMNSGNCFMENGKAPLGAYNISIVLRWRYP